MRLTNGLKEKDIASIATHGNNDRIPVTNASSQEISYIRKFMKPSFLKILKTKKAVIDNVYGVGKFFNTARENFYHGFMLGLCALVSGSFVFSNREAGKSRYDIELKPQKNRSKEELKQLSKEALRQIIDKKYDTELKNAGITTISLWCGL